MGTRNISARLALWITLAVVFTVLFCARDFPSALAQTQGDPRRTQYLFVIDDSGSMRTRPGEKGTDDDRLALFAVRSMVELLDDSDEVGVVALNAQLPEDVRSVRPLSQSRSSIMASLATTAEIAKYEGGTPCGAAMDEAKRVLNAQDAESKNQVVMFLTDGACDTEVKPQEFLSQLKSHSRGALAFYLMAFRGKVRSEGLERISFLTTGERAFELESNNPTGVLEPFAQAVTRSQGIAASVLEPGRSDYPPHQAAKRVRMLAIAPGQGPALDVRIHAKGTTQEIALQDPKQGTHQYEKGRVFRYAVVKYEPTATAVTVSVENGGTAWKVVALPEYDIRVATKIVEGRCEDLGRDTQFVDVGGTVCVHVTVTNQRGTVLQERDLGEGASLFLEHAEPSKPPAELPVALGKGGLEGTLQRPNLSAGDHAFRGVLRMSGGSLRGQRRPLAVSSQTVTPEPAAIDAGSLVPGQGFDVPTFKIKGNFSNRSAKIAVRRPEDEPGKCVTVSLHGKGEGEVIPVASGQTYNLTVRAYPFCGATSFSRTMNVYLRLEFEEKPGARLPPLEVPVTLRLDSEVQVPASLSLSIRGGEDASVPLAITGNHAADVVFEPVLPPTKERKGWPDDHLWIGFSEEGADTEGKESPKVVLGPQKSGRVPSLFARASACCGGGTYHTTVSLVQAGPTAPRLEIPVQVVVTPASAWACYGSRVVGGLGIAAAVLVLLYFLKLVTNRHTIRWDFVGQQILPRRPNGKPDNALSGLVVEQLKLTGRRRLMRLLAWLTATKLWAFGRPYRETWELTLDRRSGLLRAEVCRGYRDLRGDAEAKPDDVPSGLYVTAVSPTDMVFWSASRKDRETPEPIRSGEYVAELSRRPSRGVVDLWNAKFYATSNREKAPHFVIKRK
jgi:hypothetical protein